jgi:hypothetical protein
MLTGASNVDGDPDVGQLVHHVPKGPLAVDPDLQDVKVSAGGSTDELSEGRGDWCSCAILNLGAEGETQRYEYSKEKRNLLNEHNIHCQDLLDLRYTRGKNGCCWSRCSLGGFSFKAGNGHSENSVGILYILGSHLAVDNAGLQRGDGPAR